MLGPILHPVLFTSQFLALGSSPTTYLCPLPRVFLSCSGIRSCLSGPSLGAPWVPSRPGGCSSRWTPVTCPLFASCFPLFSLWPVSGSSCILAIEAECGRYPVGAEDPPLAFTAKLRTPESPTTDSLFTLPGYFEKAGLRIGAKGNLQRRVMAVCLDLATWLQPQDSGGWWCGWWSLGGDTSYRVVRGADFLPQQPCSHPPPQPPKFIWY